MNASTLTALLDWWWLSTERMTVTVGLDEDGFIRATPPIVRDFIGQPAGRLGLWMRQQPGYLVRRMAAA